MTGRTNALYTVVRPAGVRMWAALFRTPSPCHARSNRSAPHTTVYRRHEKEKRRCYEERVREVEHATFMPVVLSASGGMVRAATSLYRRIALLRAERRKEQYSHVISYIRCRLSFALLRSCIMCLRGSRGLFRERSVRHPESAELVVAEAQVARM